ncbi:hypothetical protein HF329_12115 [Chitinophaga oryzae]|uniref:DUF6630 domain-containing protein n=1 Tax=Chitinophaga oryzae TaxID=2725414 RepID=A0AAE6ZIG1_9BACT|nr:hypothetical protein [Chitinophaga oryzae]QJB32029.1 hypothetical protein HF329_12115 [Chitinophaga oryzae]
MNEHILQTRYVEKLVRALESEPGRHIHLSVRGLKGDIVVSLADGSPLLATLPEGVQLKFDTALKVRYPADPVEVFHVFTGREPVVFYQEQLLTGVNEHLEIALIALLRELHIAIARAIEIPALLRQRSAEEELADLRELIALLTPGVYADEADLDTIAHALYLAWSAPSSFAAFHPEFMEDEEGEDLFLSVLIKAAPVVRCPLFPAAAGLEECVSELTGEDFNLPASLQGPALFAQAQAQLLPLDWQLLHMDISPEDYYLLVVKPAAVERVIALGERFNTAFKNIF